MDYAWYHSILFTCVLPYLTLEPAHRAGTTASVHCRRDRDLQCSPGCTVLRERYQNLIIYLCVCRIPKCILSLSPYGLFAYIYPKLHYHHPLWWRNRGNKSRVGGGEKEKDQRRCQLEPLSPIFPCPSHGKNRTASTKALNT